MLRAYGPGCDGSCVEAKSTKIPDGATWIDLEEPTHEEEQLVERCLGVAVPTRDDLAEIEPSSRLFQKNGTLYMTMSTLVGVEDGAPSSTPIGFVLSRNRLVTIRYATPKPVRIFGDRALQDPELVADSLVALHGLLDAIVDRLADELEGVGAEIERISDHIFRRQTTRDRRRSIPADRLEALLVRIGRAQGLLAQVRETAISGHRLISFLVGSKRLRDAPAQRDDVLSLASDVSSLVDHSGLLAGNLTFLLEASLGLISIEQNAIIKIFSVAAVIFLPPTLVGTIYGMNFDHMPELSWLYGYPVALTAMVASAILPYLFFKRRGWL